MNNLLIEKVSQYIYKNNLLSKLSGKIIVGVSGGVDSAVLLYILHYLGYKCQAVHCNFHLRGEESLRDEKYASLLASSMNVNFLKKDYDTRYIAKQRNISIEMAARNLRYECFENLRQEQNAELIAVAHHREDSIETLLLNLIRGTGIRGLVGIKSKNGKIIRPLLDNTKQEILQFAKKNQILHMTDSSNFDEEFVRNKIRLKLIPLLRILNPSIEKTLLYVIKNLTEVTKIYDAHIEKVINRVFNPKIGVINIIELKKTPSPESILFEILKKYGFNRHIVYNVNRAIEGLSGKIFCTSQYTLIKDRSHFLLIPSGKNNENKVYLINENEKKITVPFLIKIYYKNIGNNFQIKYNSNAAYFDIEKLQFPLKLRKWEKGDKFIPFGMQNFQKLSDYFNDHKFSKLEKEQVWLLCSGNDIIWIVGKRIDNRYRIKSTTRKAVIFNFLKKN